MKRVIRIFLLLWVFLKDFVFWISFFVPVKKIIILMDWGWHYFNRLLDVLFPPVCSLCHIPTAQEHQLCPTCQNALPPPPDHYCMRCGTYTAKIEPGCGHCLTNPMASDAAYFAFRYQDSAISLIVGFKFANRSERSVLLGALCWERLGTELTWEAPDMVIPMPLHFWRLLHRRYNQSALLAGELAWRLQRPLVTNALVRRKKTTPQTRLNAQARMKNVQGAFHAVEKRVRGRSIMLVDDVMTTGATMGVAVAALKKAGAGRVVVVCLARVDQERIDSISMNKGVPYV